MKTTPLATLLQTSAATPYKAVGQRIFREVDSVMVREIARVECEDHTAFSSHTAALLAHAANMLPELVEALEALIDNEGRTVTVDTGIGCYEERHPETYDALDKARATLSRARSVPMP